VTRWLFSLLFALDEAALMAAAHGGIRTEVGAIYRTALDSGQDG
jgi:copper oxidase (laccase) domain-containing protein